MRKKIWLFSACITLLLLTGCTSGEKDSITQESAPSDEASINKEDVIRMNGTLFTKREMEFYTLMQKIFIERNRAEDLKGTIEDPKNINEYWDGQLLQYDNVNVQLQTLIELHSMALLAEEKSYYVPPELVEEHVEKVKRLIENNGAIEGLIDQYGRDDFDIEIFPYMKEYLFKQRIIKEIEKEVRTDKPDAAETEIAYETDKMYEDLYEDQVSSMELEIYLK